MTQITFLNKKLLVFKHIAMEINGIYKLKNDFNKNIFNPEEKLVLFMKI